MLQKLTGVSRRIVQPFRSRESEIKKIKIVFCSKIKLSERIKVFPWQIQEQETARILQASIFPGNEL